MFLDHAEANKSEHNPNSLKDYSLSECVWERGEETAHMCDQMSGHAHTGSKDSLQDWDSGRYIRLGEQVLLSTDPYSTNFKMT